MVAESGLFLLAGSEGKGTCLTSGWDAVSFDTNTGTKVKLDYGIIKGLGRYIDKRSKNIDPIIYKNRKCKFFLLGPFTITNINNQVITPKAKKTCAMLAMLILSPRAIRTRVWLRDKLWSDRGEKQGAASLRQALLDAKRCLSPLGEDIITSDKKSITLNIDQIHLDTDLMLRASKGGNVDVGVLKRALNEHLLEGMDVRDPEFEDWLMLERQVWEQQIGQEIQQKEQHIDLPINDNHSQAPKTLRIEQASSAAEGPKIMATVLAITLHYVDKANPESPQKLSLYDQAITQIRNLTRHSGGRTYQVENNQILIAFNCPIDAVRYSVGIHQRLVNALKEYHQGVSWALSIGINSGLVFQNKKRISGIESDIALQASVEAKDGEIMITEQSCALVYAKTDFRYLFEKKVTVQGYSQPVLLFYIKQKTFELRTGAQEFKQIRNIELDGSKGPSIGVLPFLTSDTTVQEYIGEGLADDVIVALSKNHWLHVISRNSSFSFQSNLMSSTAIATELQVDYLVSGSVKKSHSTISISVTLESTISNLIIWSESISVESDNIMQLQELVATKITSHLLQELGKHEQVRAYESKVDDITAWQLVHRGHWHMARRTTIGVKHAKQLYQRVLEKDPFQTEALLALAWWYFWKAWSEHGTKETEDILEKSKHLCRKALLMDASDGRIYAYMGAIAIMSKEPDASLGFCNEAIRLNPSLPFAYSSRGSANLLLGHPNSALIDLKNALSLNPADYYRFHTLTELASAYFFSSDFDKSIEAAENSRFLAPRYWYARLIKIACLLKRNQPGDAAKLAQEKEDIISRNISISVTKINSIPFVNRKYNETLINAYKEL